MTPPPQRSYASILRHRMFVGMFGDFNRLAAERDVPFSAAGEKRIDNHMDAFRHAFVSATLTCRLYFFFEPRVRNQSQALHAAEIGADFFGFCRKLKLPRGKSDANMDLWNEAAGREIAVALINHGTIHRDLSHTDIQRILADTVADAVKAGRTMNTPDATRLYASRFMPAGAKSAPSLSKMFRIAGTEIAQRNIQPHAPGIEETVRRQSDLRL